MGGECPWRSTENLPKSWEGMEEAGEASNQSGDIDTRPDTSVGAIGANGNAGSELGRSQEARRAKPGLRVPISIGLKKRAGLLLERKARRSTSGGSGRSGAASPEPEMAHSADLRGQADLRGDDPPELHEDAPPEPRDGGGGLSPDFTDWPSASQEHESPATVPTDNLSPRNTPSPLGTMSGAETAALWEGVPSASAALWLANGGDVGGPADDAPLPPAPLSRRRRDDVDLAGLEAALLIARSAESIAANGEGSNERSSTNPQQDSRGGTQASGNLITENTSPENPTLDDLNLADPASHELISDNLSPGESPALDDLDLANHPLDSFETGLSSNLVSANPSSSLEPAPVGGTSQADGTEAEVTGDGTLVDASVAEEGGNDYLLIREESGGDDDDGLVQAEEEEDEDHEPDAAPPAEIASTATPPTLDVTAVTKLEDAIFDVRFFMEKARRLVGEGALERDANGRVMIRIVTGPNEGGVSFLCSLLSVWMFLLLFISDFCGLVAI